MKKLFIVYFLLTFFFIFAQPVQAISVDDILNEYKQEYADWKKEKEIQKTVDKLVSIYPGANKENQRYIARQFLVNFDYATAALALQISKRESGFRSNAINFNTNKTYDKGCWQINDCHKLPDSVRLNCKKSTDWAIKKVKRDGGFNAWVAYTKYIKNNL